MTAYTLSVTGDLHDRERALDWLTGLFPVALMALFYYRWPVVLLTLTAVAGYLTVAALLQRVGALSCRTLPALVTGLLIVFCLPAGAPLWLPAVAGGAAALTAALPAVLSRRWPGRSFSAPLLQPALVGCVLVWLVFPAFMGEAPMPVQWAPLDGATAATSLAGLTDGTMAVPRLRLFLGVYPGAMGQTCTPVWLLAGLYLALRRRLRLIVPACMLATVALGSWLFWGSPLYGLLAGGTLLAAVVLADRTTVPGHYGIQAVAGVVAGLVAVLLRRFAQTDGMLAAVLIATALTPVYGLAGRWAVAAWRWLLPHAKEIYGKIKKIEKNS